MPHPRITGKTLFLITHCGGGRGVKSKRNIVEKYFILFKSKPHFLNYAVVMNYFFVISWTKIQNCRQTISKSDHLESRPMVVCTKASVIETFPPKCLL